MKLRFSAVLFVGFFFVLISSLFAANQGDRYVRLRYVEGNVVIHSADGQRPSDATINTPILDGDQLETQDGRAELAFRNGMIVRIGDYSTVRLDSTYNPTNLELLQGTLFVDSHMVDSFRDDLRIRAGEADIALVNEGNMRVDLGTEGGVRVTSLYGEAEVRANGRRVLLEAGERTYIDSDAAPEEPQAYDNNRDNLDEWNDSRMHSYAQQNDYDDDYDRGNDYDRGYGDDDTYYDSDDLNQYGDWRSYGDYGNVWVPRVDNGWRPYYDGRWQYFNSSWFWVSYEPWGWAPYHYGRWGWAYDVGWYWIPGNVFAPAWVSWYDYGDYIGWCPLNYYNRPIIYGNFNYYRPVFKQKTLDTGGAWTFVKKQQIGSPSIKKISAQPAVVKNINIDEKRVVRAPETQLVNYVIPKTQVSPGYVNDKRVVKQREDIKNPYGVGHREDQFRRDLPKNTGTRRTDDGLVQKRETARTPRDWEQERSRSPHGKSSGENNNLPVYRKGYDRDDQFQHPAEKVGRSDKNSSRDERQFRMYVSPYYRDRDHGRNPNTESDTQERGNPIVRSPGGDNDRREISPRYSDEARRVFERLNEARERQRDDQARQSRDVDRQEPRRAEPQQRQRSDSGRSKDNRGNRGGNNRQSGNQNQQPHRH